MNRPAFLVGLVSLQILTACVAVSPAEVEEGTEEASQEIGGDGASTYYIVTRQDHRKCAYPMCGGVFVKRVNQSSTKCANGKWATECHAADVDLSEVGLDEKAEADFLERFAAKEALVRGQMQSVVHESGQIVRTLVVSEAWESAGARAPDGKFYGITGTGVKCITWPCPSFHEERLNSASEATIHDLDLSMARASEEDESAGYDAAYSGGLLVAGMHESYSGPGGQGTRLRGTAFYLRVEP